MGVSYVTYGQLTKLLSFVVAEKAFNVHNEQLST